LSARVAVFFDIGDTLASPVVAGGRLSRLAVYPLVPEVLTRLRTGAVDDGAPGGPPGDPPGDLPGDLNGDLLGGPGDAVVIGLVSNTGDLSAQAMASLLAECGLDAFVDPGLCLFSSVEGVDKSSPEIFTRACARAGLPAAGCVYVGEEAAERRVAESAGLRVSPHPLHALHLVQSELLAGP
jgi:FMN phosphatase YigB (HAD superfamily)